MQPSPVVAIVGSISRKPSRSLYSQAGPSHLPFYHTPTVKPKHIKLCVHSAGKDGPSITRSRSYQTYIRTVSPSGSHARITLKPTRSGVYGQATSRGTRAYQEDTTSCSCLYIPSDELKQGYLKSSSATTVRIANQWDIEKAGGDPIASQVVWFGCFDGHGGPNVSHYLRDQLHKTFEQVKPDMVTDTVQYTRSLGGYFRRFNGGLLERWVSKEKLQPIVRSHSNNARVGRDQQERNKVIYQQQQQEQHQQQQDSNPPPKTFAELVKSAKAQQPSLLDSVKETRPTPIVEPVQVSSPSPQSQSQPSQSPPPPPSPSPPQSNSSALPSQSEPPSLLESNTTSTKSDQLAWDGLTRRIAPPKEMESETMTIAERLTLAWLATDRQIQANPSIDVGGSTASIALLHSLDQPFQPFYSSNHISITIAHLGDTRMLLCSAIDGKAIPLTHYHHPDDRSESERLRKMGGAAMITDSFGEARWMGALANTRSFGDSKYKQLGVTSEPEILSQVIQGLDYCFLIGFSDGIGGIITDQEVIDLCRDCLHPNDAALKVLKFAEELGASDNASVVVIPFKSWGKIGGKDTTKQRREFRKSKVDLYRDHRQ